MICGQFAPDGVTVQAVVPPPADVTSCQLVLVQGADAGLLSAISFPTAADAATAWWWGFTLVVGAYLFAWGAGAVVNQIKRN